MFLTRSEDKCATSANTTLHCYEQQLSRNLMKRSKCWPVNLIVEQTCHWQHCDWLMQLCTDQSTCVRVHSGTAPLTWQLFYLNKIKASYFKLRNGIMAPRFDTWQIFFLHSVQTGQASPPPPHFLPYCVGEKLIFFTLHRIRTERWLFRASHIRQNNIQHLTVRGAGFPIQSTWRLEQFAVCAAEIASRKRT